MEREIKFRLWGPVSNTYTGEPKMEFVTLNMLLYHDGYYHSTGGEADGDFKIMQYTGIKDKHGKEIYEGDIIDFTFFYYGEIEIEQNYKGVVLFDGLSFNFRTSEETHVIAGLNFDSESDIEVIGNIYDNENLLKI